MASPWRITQSRQMECWVSPRLGVRLTLEEDALVLCRPDGERFVPSVELRQRMERSEREAERERQRAKRLAERLRELGVNPEEVE